MAPPGELAVPGRVMLNEVGHLNERRHQTNVDAFYAEGVGRWAAYHPYEGLAQASLAYCWGNALAGLSQTEEGLKLVAVSGVVEAWTGRI